MYQIGLGAVSDGDEMRAGLLRYSSEVEGGTEWDLTLAPTGGGG